MCLTSAPSIGTPSTAPPQYLHNTYLDTPQSGNSQASGSQNELAGGFARQSANSSALQGAVTPTQSTSGVQINPLPQNAPYGPATPRTPGLIIPTIGNPAGPAMGGVFAGATPNTGARVVAK